MNSLNDFENIEFLSLTLNGAALIIQTAWRNYINNKNMLDKKNKNQDETFACDVVIYVQKQPFFCHSLVLAVTSKYFKRIFNEYTKESGVYKFEIETSSRYWSLIQTYMYGYDIIISRQMITEITKLAKELEIQEMVHNLDKILSHSALNASKCDVFYLSSRQPVQLVGSYYKFFNCVIYFYCCNKIDLKTTCYYISNDFINYSTMSNQQLLKCIYQLKTRLRLKKSTLLLQLIQVYLKINDQRQRSKKTEMALRKK